MREKLNSLLEGMPLETKLTLMPTEAILVGWRGSIAHGMYLDPEDPLSVDDKDLMAVCAGPLEHYLGLEGWGSRGTKEVWEGDWDVVQYEVRKFVGLLEKGNPNVLSLLWLEDDYYLKKTIAGAKLIQARDLFAVKNVWASFRGYADGQLKRMHRGEFKGHLGAKRRALFEQFGYDAKAAAHMIRLLRMAVEFLQEGRLHVYRPDAQELMTIKKGEWTEQEVVHEFEYLIQAADEAYQKSRLPDQVDRQKVNELLTEILIPKLGLINSMN